MNTDSKLIPLVQACRRLGLSAQTMRSRICKGQPTPFRIAKHPITGGLVVDEQEIEAYRTKLFSDHRVDREVKA